VTLPAKRAQACMNRRVMSQYSQYVCPSSTTVYLA
jgi:hypothetical protein